MSITYKTLNVAVIIALALAIAAPLQGTSFAGGSGKFPIKLPVGWESAQGQSLPGSSSIRGCVGPTVIVKPFRRGAPFVTEHGANCTSHNQLAVGLNYLLSLLGSLVIIGIIYLGARQIRAMKA